MQNITGWTTARPTLRSAIRKARMSHSLPQVMGAPAAFKWSDNVHREWPSQSPVNLAKGHATEDDKATV